MSIRAPQADVSQSSARTNPLATRTGAAGNVASGTGSAAVADDTVTLTSTAAQLVRLEESLRAVPDVDSNRVQAVKAAIEDGSYQIDPDKIVQRLLSLENDLY